MGRLRNGQNSSTIPLRHRHLIGRASNCDLRVDDPQVSALHATVWWSDGWLVRDLGSRNGTWVDGERLETGVGRRIEAGSEMTFGVGLPNWTLCDDSPPVAEAWPRAGGEPTRAQFGLLALPDSDAPTATVYRSEGAWVIEDSDGVRAIEDRGEVTAGEVVWRLHLPESVAETMGGVPLSIDNVALHLRVSMDEEHVEAVLACDGRRIQLPARAHLNTVLYLVRARLADASPTLPESARGWVYADDAAHALGISEGRLNLHVFRARQQLAEAGVEDAGSVIERRSGARQLRIGVAVLSVTRV